jgi:8-amino-7-oxononanoate synthase
MSNDGNGQTFSKMNSSLKENLLDRMRNTHQSSERNRMARPAGI